MGKQKRQRQKLHLKAPHAAAPAKAAPIPDSFMDANPSQPPLLRNDANIFEGLKINIGSLNKNLPDLDLQSVKSFKSIKKSDKGIIIPKKDKLKLRREMFLKKIDTVNQLKKESKIRKKRKNTPIIGDINPLRDALPSLDSLLKQKSDNILHKENSKSKIKKPKAVEKASRQKKNYLQGIHIYKRILKNKNISKDPLTVIAQQVKAIVDFEKKEPQKC